MRFVLPGLLVALLIVAGVLNYRIDRSIRQLQAAHVMPTAPAILPNTATTSTDELQVEREQLAEAMAQHNEDEQQIAELTHDLQTATESAGAANSRADACEAKFQTQTIITDSSSLSLAGGWLSIAPGSKAPVKGVPRWIIPAEVEPRFVGQANSQQVYYWRGPDGQLVGPMAPSLLGGERP